MLKTPFHRFCFWFSASRICISHSGRLLLAMFTYIITSFDESKDPVRHTLTHKNTHTQLCACKCAYVSVNVSPLCLCVYVCICVLACACICILICFVVAPLRIAWAYKQPTAWFAFKCDAVCMCAQICLEVLLERLGRREGGVSRQRGKHNQTLVPHTIWDLFNAFWNLLQIPPLPHLVVFS